MNTLQPLSLAGRILMPNGERARYLRLAIKVLVYTLIFTAFFYLFLFFRGENLDMPTVTMFNLGVGLVVMIPRLFFYIALLMWLARAYRNLRRAGLNTRFAPEWAVGAWFVPLMNFVRPYYIVKETWIRTQTAFKHPETAPTGYSAIKYWWLCFIVLPLLLGFMLGLASRGHAALDTDVLFTTSFLGAILQIIALFMFSGIVRKISVMETEFAERFLIAQAVEIQKTAEQYIIEQSLAVPLPAGEEQEIPIERESKILTGEFIETKGLAKTMIACLVVLLIAVVLLFVIDSETLQTDVISNGTRQFFGLATTVTAMASVLAVPILLSAFIVWVNRSYNNLRALRVKELRISGERQKIWWLIPAVNLFYAWNMLREIKKHSQLALTTQEEEPEPLPLLDWMWFAFILGGLFFWLAMKLTNENGYAGPDATLRKISGVLSYLLFIFGFISSIIVTRKITAFQSELFARVEAAVDNDTSADYLKTIQ